MTNTERVGIVVGVSSYLAVVQWEDTGELEILTMPPEVELGKGIVMPKWNRAVGEKVTRSRW